MLCSTTQQLQSNPAGQPSGRCCHDDTTAITEPPNDFVCPVSLELMVSPVILLQTAQVYDNSSLTDWLSSGGTSCPMTGIKLEAPIILRPHISLRNKIEEWAKANGILLPQPAYSGSVKRLAKPKDKSRTVKVVRDVVKFLLSERPY